MKPLLRKDAPWLLGFGLAGLVFALVMQAEHEGPWILPDDEFSKLSLAFHWVAATLLGLVGAVIDDLTRTREYLLHRSLSRPRIFWTRHLAGLTVVAGWIFLVPALHLLATLIFRQDRFLVEPGRYWRLVDGSTPALAFYAAGVFSGTVVRRLVWALPLAALTATGTLLVFLPRVAGRSLYLFGMPLFAVVLPLAAVFLVVALRSERDGREADQPWSRPRVLTAGLLLVALLVPGLSFALGGLEQGTLEELFKQYPFIGQRTDGQAVLFVKRKDRRKLLAVDASHQVITELPPEAVERSYNPDRINDPLLPFTMGTMTQFGRRFGDRFTRAYACPGQLHCYLSSDGYVELVRQAPSDGLRDWGEPIRMRAGHPPDNQPFAPHVMPIGGWWAGTAFMADLDAGVLWAADLTRDEPRFAVLPLPGGDRLRLDLTQDIMSAPRFRNGPTPPLVIAGERGIYSLNQDVGPAPDGPGVTLVPAPPAIATLAVQASKHYDKDVEVIRHGVTGASVKVTWRNGGPTLSHDYAPRTLLERALAVALYSTALVRPSAFALASLVVPVAPARNPSPTWVLSARAHAMSKLVVVANLGLALLLAGLVWRRLSGFGASPARRWFWVVATFFGGVPAYLVVRCIETRRAWLPVVAAPTQAPAAPLLIQTA